MIAGPTRRRAPAAPSILLLAVLLAAPPRAAAASPFGSYFETLYGHRPTPDDSWWPVVGDLDGDGRDDFLRLSESPGPTALVRFGEPDGRLDAVPLALDLAGTSVQFADWPCIDDLDGDGHKDIVIGAYGALVVVRGLGGRAFAPPVAMPEDCRGYASSTDLTGDGVPDYACLSAGAADSVHIRFGLGALAFSPGVSFAVHPGAEGVYLEDFDGDGRDDVFVGGASGATLVLNQGGGAFAAVDVPGAAAARPAGDLNGDGLGDLFASGGAYLGLGAGAFGPAIPHGMADPRLTVDLDEDGRPDLVGLRTISGSYFVSVMRGLGDGSFGPEALTPSYAFPTELECGDFDQDGHQDLVTLRWDTPYEAYLYGRGTGGFRQSARSFPAAVSGPLCLGHLGPDSHPDVVVAAGGSAALAVLLASGPASYAAPVSYATGAAASGVAAGDLDGDGRDDVVVSYAGLASFSVWLTQPGGTLGARADVAATGGSKSVRLADLDRDGALDAVFASGWWRHGNGDGTFGPQNALPAALSVGGRFEVADLDGNGAPDLVGASPVGGARVMLATSPGVFPAFTDYAGLIAATSVATAFVDADTLRDVLVQSDSLWLFRGTGGGALASRVSLGPGPGGLRLAADLDGDGLADFVGAPPGSQSVGVCLGTGGRPRARVGFGTRTPGAPVFGAHALADVDGNGAPDIVVSEALGPLVTVLLNQTITPNVGVPPAGRPAARLAVRAVPNPAAGAIGVRLDLADTSPVEIELFDLAGRRVSVTTRERPGGPIAVVPLAGSEQLAPGVYLVRVRQGAASATARVCRVR